MKKTILFIVMLVIILIAGCPSPGSDGSSQGGAVNKGILDTSFSGDGIVTHDSAGGGSSYDAGRGITGDSAGNVYVTGFSKHAGVPVYSMIIWKYKSNGELDTTFGTGGIVSFAPTGNSAAGFAIALDSAGNVYVTGYTWTSSNSTRDIAVWKYSPAGTAVSSFGNSGLFVHAGSVGADYGHALVLDSSGNIFVTGEFMVNNGATTTQDMIILKITPGGQYSTDFGDVVGGTPSGWTTYHNAAGGSGEDIGKGVDLDSGGNIIIAGYSRNSSGTNDMVVWKCWPNGGLYTSFGTNGIIVESNTAGGNGTDEGYSVKLDNSDHIYVAGHSRNASGNYDMVVWKYNSNGTPDTGFSGNGSFVHNNAAGGNSNDLGRSLVMDSNNSLYVAGNSYGSSGHLDLAVWKLHSNGTLDSSFGNGGIVIHSDTVENDSENGYSIYRNSNHRIYITGQSKFGGSGSRDMIIWKYR